MYVRVDQVALNVLDVHRVRYIVWKLNHAQTFSNIHWCYSFYKIVSPCYQGGWIIYFGESFLVSMAHMVSDFWKLDFISMVWRNYCHWIWFGRFSSQFYGEYFLTKYNVLFNNEHLILIWFFLLIDNGFDLKLLGGS